MENYYQSLYEVAAALNSARAAGDILQAMVENAANSVGARGCSLMLLSPNKRVLLHTAAYGLSDCVGAVANLGAIPLENAKLYDTLKKDYESFRRDMLEHHPLRDWECIHGFIRHWVERPLLLIFSKERTRVFEPDRKRKEDRRWR